MIHKIILVFQLLFLFFIKVAVSQKFNAEVVNYSTTCNYQGEKITQTDTIAIQINNRVGDIYAEIEIPYSKMEFVINLVFNSKF